MAEPNTRLEDRIAGRREFEALQQLATNFDGVSPDWLDGFARAAREWANNLLGHAEELMVMSNENAIKYGNKPIEFGDYHGTPIREVPIERLTWYADKALPLQAYLRSDVGQRRIDENK